jgi:hypothetical protein
MSLDLILAGAHPPQTKTSPPMSTAPPKMADPKAMLTATKMLSTASAGKAPSPLASASPPAPAHAPEPSVPHLGPLGLQNGNARAVEGDRKAYKEHVQAFRLGHNDLPNLNGLGGPEYSRPHVQPSGIPLNYAGSTIRPYSSLNIMAGTGFSPPAVLTGPIRDMVNDCNNLHWALSQVSDKAVRRVVRDLWERTLVGSDSHCSFVVRFVRQWFCR